MSQDPAVPPAPPAGPPPPPAAPPPPPPPSGGTTDDGPRLPWEERDRLGFLDALIETVKLLVTAPKDAFSRLRLDGDLIWPLVFGFILSWVGQVFGQVWSLIFGSAVQSMMGGLSSFEGMAAFGAGSVIQVIATLALWPIIFLIFIFIGTGVYHLCLMLVGGVERSPMGFEGTLKVVSYTQVTSLLSVIPILGGLIAVIATLVLTVIGFVEVHKTTQGKAILAVVIPLILCCICAGVIAMMFGAAIAAAAAGASAG